MAIKVSLPILGQPNPHEVKDVHLVGRYALGVTWADDHSSIYPFPRLRLDDPARAQGDPAGADAPDERLTEAMGWPRESTLPTAIVPSWQLRQSLDEPVGCPGLA